MKSRGLRDLVPCVYSGALLARSQTAPAHASRPPQTQPHFGGPERAPLGRSWGVREIPFVGRAKASLSLGVLATSCARHLLAIIGLAAASGTFTCASVASLCPPQPLCPCVPYASFATASQVGLGACVGSAGTAAGNAISSANGRLAINAWVPRCAPPQHRRGSRSAVAPHSPLQHTHDANENAPLHAARL